MTDLPIEANACGLSLRDLDAAVEKEVCMSLNAFTTYNSHVTQIHYFILSVSKKV